MMDTALFSIEPLDLSPDHAAAPGRLARHDHHGTLSESGAAFGVRSKSGLSDRRRRTCILQSNPPLTHRRHDPSFPQQRSPASYKRALDAPIAALSAVGKYLTGGRGS